MRYLSWQRWLSGVLVLATLLGLAACTVEEDPVPTSIIDDDFANTVSVTGKLTPREWTAVGTTVGGQVVAISGEEGEAVDVGDVLLRLDDRDARLAIRQAEANLQQAVAELTRLQAGPREEDVAVAEAQIETATATLYQAAKERDQLRAGQLEARLAAADAEIAAAQSQELTTRQIHDEMMKCHTVELEDGSTKEICPTLGTYEERARFEWHAARAALTAADQGKAAIEPEHEAQVTAASAAVGAAARQVNLAEAQAARVQATARAEEIAVAQAGVAQAEAALAAAELNLTHTVVEAPIAGTVGAIDVRLGQFATPGVPVITLGDLTTLRVETTDLDEIDVGRVAVGQEAVVTFDALPDRTFNATVVRISPMAATTGGGVTYTVILELAELDPVLRWGMTAFVDIEIN